MYAPKTQPDALLSSTTDCEQPKERKNSKFLTELRAGLTTFFTMAYIIAVNVSDSPPNFDAAF